LRGRAWRLWLMGWLRWWRGLLSCLVRLHFYIYLAVDALRMNVWIQVRYHLMYGYHTPIKRSIIHSYHTISYHIMTYQSIGNSQNPAHIRLDQNQQRATENTHSSRSRSKYSSLSTLTSFPFPYPSSAPSQNLLWCQKNSPWYR
jgi:hypothetical protein